MDNTGSDLVKKLRPFGCALAIICFVGFFMVCFTAGGDDTLPGYEAPEIATASELASELEENVLPRLEGIVSCTEENGKVVLEIEKKQFFPVRNVILNYFDASLVEFVEAGQAERG